MRRLLPLPVMLLLAGCGGATSLPGGLSIIPTTTQPPAAPVSSAVAPDLSSVDVIKMVKDKADELKLLAPLLVSAPDASPSINIEPWMICLKSGAAEHARRLYVLLFQDGKLKTARSAAILDKCEERSFAPLNVAALTPPAKAPAKARGHRRRDRN